MIDPESNWTAAERWLANALATSTDAVNTACPEPEELIGLIEAAGSHPDAERLLGHVAGCGYCRREFAELRAALNEATAFQRASEHGLPPSPVAITLVPDPAGTSVETPLQQLPQLTQRRTFRPMLAITLAAAASILLLTLLWSSRTAQTVALQKDAGRGNVGGTAAIPGLDPALEHNLRTILATGRAPMTPSLANLNFVGDGRGAMQNAHGIILLRPVITCVRSDRPRLVWSMPSPVANSLVVISDAQRREVARGRCAGPPGEMRWTPSAPLAPGQVYLWQVTDQQTGASSAIAPFVVLSRFDAAAVGRAAATLRDHPDLLGALYARYGLLDDAISVLAGSTTPQARTLLASVRKGRR